MSEPTNSPPMPETITVDLACVSCGYNMKTLAVNSYCPECGRAVMETLGAWQAAAVRPEMVRSMRQQATVLGWMPVAALVSTIVGLCLGAPGISDFALLMCTMIHVLGTATFVAAAEDVLGSPRSVRIGATAAAIFGLGAVSAFVVGRPLLILLMIPVTVTSASVYCTRYAAQVAGAAGPDDLGRFGGSVFRLTQVASAAASVLFVGFLLGATKILAASNIWLLGFVLSSVCSMTLLTVWMVFHMVLMFRMKRWLGRALVGLEFFHSPGEVEQESQQGGG